MIAIKPEYYAKQLNAMPSLELTDSRQTQSILCLDLGNGTFSCSIGRIDRSKEPGDPENDFRMVPFSNTGEKFCLGVCWLEKSNRDQGHKLRLGKEALTLYNSLSPLQQKESEPLVRYLKESFEVTRFDDETSKSLRGRSGILPVSSSRSWPRRPPSISRTSMAQSQHLSTECCWHTLPTGALKKDIDTKPFVIGVRLPAPLARSPWTKGPQRWWSSCIVSRRTNAGRRSGTSSWTLVRRPW